jgi:2-polyprenyl-6-methoxyphenol hydroxylase-like FAD-dependent oxidoreductase
MEQKRGHAIVMGASMAGLTAARALSNHFSSVTVIERDQLPAEAEARKGVPQGRHAHGLLATGYNVLDSYFPTMFDEAVEAGARRGDINADFLWYQYGGWKLRMATGLEGVIMSRSLLESLVRKHTRAIANVTFCDGFDAEAPIFENGAVRGLEVKAPGGSKESFMADLVVDATGRGSQSPKWLREWGYAAVPETEIRINVGYATALFERRPDDLWGTGGAIIAGTVPRSTRFAAALQIEGDMWMVTLVGALEDYPPTDLQGWLAFAESLPTPDLRNLLEGREPIGEIQAYRYPANRRRHYDQMASFPSGYLVTGDAVCSFNPVYGQGMSVAAAEAKALDDCLSSGVDPLWKGFYRRAKKITDSPWTIATGEDLKYPQVVGKRPPGFGMVNRYMARAHAACAKDPVVLRQFFKVANLMAPPASMLSPRIGWRVALGGRGTAQELPIEIQQ